MIYLCSYCCIKLNAIVILTAILNGASLFKLLVCLLSAQLFLCVFMVIRFIVVCHCHLCDGLSRHIASRVTEWVAMS